MRCNACVSLTDDEHHCIPQRLQGNCPICHEAMFQSTEPLKGLKCGHVMHLSCFGMYMRGQSYTVGILHCDLELVVLASSFLMFSCIFELISLVLFLPLIYILTSALSAKKVSRTCKNILSYWMLECGCSQCQQLIQTWSAVSIAKIAARQEACDTIL